MLCHVGSKVPLRQDKMLPARRPLSPAPGSLQTGPDSLSPARRRVCRVSEQEAEAKIECAKQLKKIQRFTDHVGTDFKINSFPMPRF